MITDDEKWAADRKLREREIVNGEAELDVHKAELEIKRSRWTSPLTTGILLAGLAGFSNAYVAYKNNDAQRTLAKDNAAAQPMLEKQKADQTLVLERQ